MAEHDVIRGGAVGGHPQPGSPQGAHPACLSAPPAVPQQNPARSFYSQPDSEAWKVLKSREEPGPGAASCCEVAAGTHGPRAERRGRLGVPGMRHTTPRAPSSGLEPALRHPELLKNLGM